MEGKESSICFRKMTGSGIKDGLEERERPGKRLLLLSVWEVRFFV